LAEVGTDFHNRCRFAPAGGAGFEKDAVGNFPLSPKALRIGKAVVSPKAADRLALVLKEGQSWMPGDGIAKTLEFTVDGTLAECQLGGERIEKDVDVFREALNEVPAF
jgi:hypothetical protein